MKSNQSSVTGSNHRDRPLPARDGRPRLPGQLPGPPRKERDHFDALGRRRRRGHVLRWFIAEPVHTGPSGLPHLPGPISHG